LILRNLVLRIRRSGVSCLAYLAVFRITIVIEQVTLENEIEDAAVKENSSCHSLTGSGVINFIKSGKSKEFIGADIDTCNLHLLRIDFKEVEDTRPAEEALLTQDLSRQVIKVVNSWEGYCVLYRKKGL
jgi:hypothetical protein